MVFDKAMSPEVVAAELQMKPKDAQRICDESTIKIHSAMLQASADGMAS